MMRRNTIIALALLFLITGTVSYAQEKSFAHGQPSKNRSIVAAVRMVLDAQRDAWNRGDVAGYMDGYARSADITFISGDNISRGWQTVFDRYQKNYNSREKMGTLTFSDLETTVLNADSAVVLGRWHLQRSNDEPHGRFTLIFRRTKQGWRIVHDHTSAAS
jgi:ketosteroid isomerase-like protein